MPTPSILRRSLSTPRLPVLSAHYWGLGGLLLTLCLCATAHAATLNVPTTAYPTIQAGINAAHDGDTVLVADGTYTGPGNRDLDYGGKSITVTSQHGAIKTIIDCQGTASNPHRGFYFHNEETNAATVDGLTIENGYAPNDPNYGFVSRGGGISTVYSDPTISNCIFTHNVASSGGGVALYSSVAIILGCAFIANTGTSYSGGIDIYYVSDAIVTNCVFYKNNALIGGGMIVSSSSRSVITNCTIANNTSSYSSGGGLLVNYNALANLSNCLVWSNIGGTVNVSGATATIINSDVQGGYTGTGNIDADPLFVNAAGGDLHLKAGSPCIGKGTHTGAPATDLDGKTRPNPPSMGAYEYVASGPPAKVTGFALLPNVVNTPAATVTATLTADGPFQSVRLTSNSDQTTETPPSIPMQQSATAGIWTATFTASFLAQAKVNPFTLKAVGTRPDGTQTQAVATLTVNPNAPVLDLAFGASVPAAKKGQTVSLQGLASNFSTVKATLATLKIVVPAGVDVNTYSGVSYDTGTRTLSWSGPLAGYQSLQGFKFKVTVTTSRSGTTLHFPATLSCTGFPTVTVDVPLTIGSGLVPVDVAINAGGGYGLLDGTRTLQNGGATPPLSAALSPRLTEPTLYGDRNFVIWMGCTVSHTDGVTLSGSPNLVKAGLAARGMIAPSTAPEYIASFPKVGDHVDMSVSFTPEAALFSFVDLLVTGAASNFALPTPSIDRVIQLEADISQLGNFKKAAQRFHPLPKNLLTLTIASAGASYDLLTMSATERLALKTAVEKAFDTKLNDKKFNDVVRVFFGVKKVGEFSSDLFTLIFATNGDPMTVRFEASP